LVSLANAFVEAGRGVHFVALRRGGDVDALLDPRVLVSVLDERPRPRWKPWTFEGWGRLAEWIERHRPDVVLAGVNTVHAAATVASARAVDARPVLVLRASQYPARSFPWSSPYKKLREPVEQWTRRRLYDRAALVIAVSTEVREALAARMRDSGRCVALPNPVITPGFIAELSKPADHPWLRDGGPVILAVGRLVWSKRFDLLLEALAVVRRSVPARLVILGEGKSRADLEAHAERLGLKDAMAMPGAVSNIASWLAGADLLVSTSAYEGSPAVLIEAMAAGVPVVATRCPGGSEELLADGAGGTLIPMDDAEAAAAAILRELEAKRDPALLKRSVSQYSVEASAAAYLAALDQAVATRRGKPCSIGSPSALPAGRDERPRS